MTETEAVSNGKKNEENGDSITDLEKAIIRQVEYYFGDINLSKDKFLKEQITLDDGWVPYSTMLKFNRLANLTTDTSVITAALSKSKTQLMEVSEDSTKIRRSPAHPLPELNEERRKELMTRTIYAKGFPKEGTTLDMCLKFFQQYDPENIIMRKYQDTKTKKFSFKGSIFVVFKTKEEAEKFLDVKSVKYEETELIRKWQSKYLEEKQVEMEEKSKKYAKKKNKQEEKKRQEADKPTLVLPKGSVILLKEVPSEITRESIKEAIIKLDGEVAFIKIDEKQAWIRLQKEDSAKPVFEKFNDGKITVENEELTGELPDAETEKNFLDEMANELIQRKQKFGKHKGGNKNFGRKRRGRGDDGPENKKRK